MESRRINKSTNSRPRRAGSKRKGRALPRKKDKPVLNPNIQLGSLGNTPLAVVGAELYKTDLFTGDYDIKVKSLRFDPFEVTHMKHTNYMKEKCMVFFDALYGNMSRDKGYYVKLIYNRELKETETVEGEGEKVTFKNH